MAGFQSSSRSSSRSYWDLKSGSIGDVPFLHLSAASTPLLRGELGGLSYALPSLPRRRGSKLVPQASKDVPYSFRYPPMTKKPRWWWRALACIPYLMPLHETWMYAETAYHLHPFLEDFEYFTYPFLGAIGSLPRWFLLAYFFLHIWVMGSVSRWMPHAIYWGKIGMHFWTAVAFAFLFTVLECIRCALAGMYADVPFVCDAAYIQIPYD
ncbi:Tic20-like protein [Corchorus olitorius]|uniref:Protein TIC 20 n=1 Tax=Corchorus olitorius TaxID=93759 RepID=A0A1R3HY14_9ROSI|nr:Tic20-like protein [Corchorus olitorius]